MSARRRGAAVTLWVAHGHRRHLDERLDEHLPAVAGRGTWTRWCTACGSTDHGQREFVTDDGARRIRVSVSHAGQWHVAATGWEQVAIGVDLVDRSDIGVTADTDWLADWVSPTSMERLRQVPPPDRPMAALVLWAAREARGKRDGVGLSPPRGTQQHADVPLLATKSVRGDVRTAVRSGATGWWARSDVPGHECVVAGDAEFHLAQVVRVSADRRRSPVAV